MGAGGHGAHPEQTIDPFYILGHVIIALNGIVSRRISPFQPVVVSIGMINGGFTQNVIPEQVEISGTLRYTDPLILEHIREEIRRAFEITRSFGGNFELKFEFGGGPNINHEVAVALIKTAGATILGEENIHPGIPTLGAEDFGAFTENIPGAMFTLGTLIEGDERTLHHPRFDIDERAMPLGTAVLVEAVLQYLRINPDNSK
jgi:amidohydrolase